MTDLSQLWAANEQRENPKLKITEPPPIWAGGDLCGRGIYVHAEQGAGDEILYASMVPDLIAAGAGVMLACSPLLKPLFKRAFSCNVTSKLKTPNLRAYDYQIAAGSLGKFLRPTIESFPKRAYLTAAPSDLRGKYLALADHKKIIGVSWYSLAKPSESLRLHGLLDNVRPEASLVNLQYGDTYAERMGYGADSAWSREVYTDATVDPLMNLEAFAAQVAACDAVYTTSNTAAHMAGALGVETHLFLGESSHWYWGLPWYPKLTIHTL